MMAEWAARLQGSAWHTERSRSILNVWRWLSVNGRKMLPGRENRRLRVTESVSLGDRRFVVLVEVDHQQFLVGASAAGVTLLTPLQNATEPSTHAEALHQAQPGDGTLSATPADTSTAVVTQSPAAAVSTPQFPVSHTVKDFHVSLATAEAAFSAPPQAERLTTAHTMPLHAALPQTAFPASASARRHAFGAGSALVLLFASCFLLPARMVHAQSTPATTTTAAASSSTQAAPEASARTTPSKPSSSGVSLTGLGSSSAPWTIVVLLTVLTLIPSLMICMTPFARLLVVFHFLRQALGLQTTPSNQTLIGLSLILTFFIMEPLGKQMYNGSFVPLQNGKITALEAVDRGSEPLRHFMAHYVREKDAALFLEIAHAPRPKTIDDVSLRVLMPAYIVSELKAGFQIGAVLFLPFLVVDIVIASITTSVGMMQLPPVVISTPLKLMLFLMVDGWHLLIGALVRSFY